MLIRPASLAPRLSTQPPAPRMAPVRVWISRAGSSMVVARICRAQEEFTFEIAGGRGMGFISSFIGWGSGNLDRCTGTRQSCPTKGQFPVTGANMVASMQDAHRNRNRPRGNTTHPEFDCPLWQPVSGSYIHARRKGLLPPQAQRRGELCGAIRGQGGSGQGSRHRDQLWCELAGDRGYARAKRQAWD